MGVRRQSRGVRPIGGVAIPIAFLYQWISLGIYTGVALLWLIPNRRIERVLGDAER